MLGIADEHENISDCQLQSDHHNWDMVLGSQRGRIKLNNKGAWCKKRIMIDHQRYILKMLGKYKIFTTGLSATLHKINLHSLEKPLFIWNTDPTHNRTAIKLPTNVKIYSQPYSRKRHTKRARTWVISSGNKKITAPILRAIEIANFAIISK